MTGHLKGDAFDAAFFDPRAGHRWLGKSVF